MTYDRGMVRRLLLLGVMVGALAACELPGALDPIPVQPTVALELPEPSLELALEHDPRWLLARVRLGEREVLAAFDTGLSVRALVDDALCEELALPMQRGLWSTDGGGGSGYKRGTTLEQLSWGPFQQEGIRALRGDLSFLRAANGEAVQLVLGMRLFNGRTVQLDAVAGRVRIWEDARLPAVGRNQVVPVRRLGGVPFCPLQVDGENLRLLLDTGFDGALALPDRLRGEVELVGEARRTGRVRTALGEGGAIYTGRLASDLTFAGFRFESPGVQFLEGYEHAVLGRGALERLILTLDVRGGRAHFARVAPPAESAEAGILGNLSFPGGPNSRSDAR